jgi:lipoprotein NlpI
VQMDQGDLAAALTSFRASLAIADLLAKSDPGNARWQRDLSVSYDNVGDVQMDQGDLAAALASYEASQAIRDLLAKSAPGNAGGQRDLSVSCNKVGDVQKAQGDLPAALASYQASLAIREGLAKSDPANAGWQRDLSAVHNKVGKVQLDQGDLPAALASYQSGLAIAEKLAKSDPSNAGWQRELSISHDNVGDVQMEQGDLPAALTSYQTGLAVMQRLLTLDPDNAGWLRDLAISYNKAGYAQFDLGRVEEALHDFNAAVQIGKAPNNSEIYWRRALAKLYTNDAAGAADDAAMALKLESTNPYYAIWLHIARARERQNDGDELAANAKHIDSSRWPWPVVALFLGSMNPDETQAAALSADQHSTRLGHSCEADFYIGVYRIEKGAQTDARTLLQSAADHCPHNFIEYAAAMLELKQLDGWAGAPPK